MLDLEKIADKFCNNISSKSGFCEKTNCCYSGESSYKECFDRLLKLRQTIAAERIAKALITLADPTAALDTDKIKQIIKMTKEECDKLALENTHETD